MSGHHISVTTSKPTTYYRSTTSIVSKDSMEEIQTTTRDENADHLRVVLIPSVTVGGVVGMCIVSVVLFK